MRKVFEVYVFVSDLVSSQDSKHKKSVYCLTKILNAILCLIFGQKYKRFIRKVSVISVFASQLISNQDSELQRTWQFRLERVEEKNLALTSTVEWHFLALQNQIFSLQKQVEDLKNKPNFDKT